VFAIYAERDDSLQLFSSCSGEAIEEAGASNFFAVFPNNTIVTPALDSETILPGVTRSSVMELAEKECGCTVVEGRLTISDLEEACEAFCCGTGAGVTPVGSVNVANEDGTEDPKMAVVFGDSRTPGPVTQRLYKLLLDLQTGADEELNKKYEEWIHIVEP
jgi:branched-subunit amino acid aminotransferase/4-amino-4-deoxychorismate lyase